MGRRIGLLSRTGVLIVLTLVTLACSGGTSSATPSPTVARGQIAYACDKAGHRDICVMNTDGTGLRRLTDDPAKDGGPDWSPDGKKIAFISDRDGNFEIYAMNADGTGVMRLTSHAGDDSFPAWSPDGTKIAFASNRDGNAEIYVMNADGTGGDASHERSGR